MTQRNLNAARFVLLALSFAAVSFSAAAQSGASRPRRTLPQQPTQTSSSDDANAPQTNSASTSAQTRSRTVSPSSNSGEASSSNSDVAANKPPATFTGRADTMHAFQLLQQKKYAEAEAEALALTRMDAKNSEAWKIAGFAELSLQKYTDAARSLERARELQRAEAGKEDPHTIDALATAYIRAENFDKALPLLVAATTRADEKPNAELLFFRGLAEYRTNKPAEAERSFSAAVKLNPKDTVSLFYLGRIAAERRDTDAATQWFNRVIALEPKNAVALFYLGRIASERNDLTTAVNMLNRATAADPKLAEAWTLLAYSYLQRAASQKSESAAAADYLSATRAAENLTRLRPDESSYELYGRTLIYAKKYPLAVSALEKAATERASATTFFLLGDAQLRAGNTPQAIAAFNRAVLKSPDDQLLLSIYRELGYAYEVTKDYKNALDVYQKALQLAPNDASFKESVERVRPFAK
jgi:tetratricopeptide (TPR) repeat protein